MPATPVAAGSSGHAGAVTATAVRGDGRRVVSCATDGSVLVWDVTDPSRPSRLTQLRHEGRVNAAAWNPLATDLLATASDDRSAAVWRIVDDRPPYRLSLLAGQHSAVTSVVWLPDGRHLVCTTQDGPATLWNTQTGACLGEIADRASRCAMVTAAPSGLVAMISRNKRVAVRRPLQEQHWRTRHYSTSVEAGAFSPNGSMLAVARADGAIDLLTPHLDLIRTVPLSGATGRSIGWAGDDTFVVGADDSSLHIFEVSGRLLRRIHDDRFWTRSISIVDTMLGTGSFWGNPQLIDLTTGAELSTAPATSPNMPHALALVGDSLVIGCESGLILAVTPAADDSDPQVRLLADVDDPVLVLTTRGEEIYAGTASGRVLRYDAGTTDSSVVGAPVRSLCATAGSVVAGTSQGELISLEPTKLRVTARAAAHFAAITALSPLRDGLLSVATDGTAATGTPQDRTTIGHPHHPIAAAAVLGDQVVAVAHRDRTIQLTRLVAPSVGPQQRVVFVAPPEGIKALTLLGESSAPTIVAAAEDFGLYAWRVDWAGAGGELPPRSLVGEFPHGISCLAGDGVNQFAAAGRDGTLVLAGPDVGGGLRIRRTFWIEDLVARALTTTSAGGIRNQTRHDLPA